MLIKKNTEQQKKLNHMIENSLTTLSKDREMFDDMTLTFLQKQVSENGKFLIYGDIQTGKTTLLKALVNEFGKRNNITLLEEETDLSIENITPLITSPDSIYIEPSIRKQKEYNLIIDELSSKQALYLLDTMGVKAKNSVITFSFNEDTDTHIFDSFKKYISYIKNENSKMLGNAITTLIYTKLVDNNPKIVKIEYFSLEKQTFETKTKNGDIKATTTDVLTLKTLFDITKKESEKEQQQSNSANNIEEIIRNRVREATRQNRPRSGILGNQPTGYRRNSNGAIFPERPTNIESAEEMVRRMIDDLNRDND